MGEQTQIDAVVTDQILRPLRVWPLFEIGRRTNHGHAQVRPDAHGDHVFRNAFPGPNPRVITLGNDFTRSRVSRCRRPRKITD